MKKTLLILTLILTSYLGFSQTTTYTWHAPSDCFILPTVDTQVVTYSNNEANPNSTGNMHSVVTKMVPGEKNSYVTYALPEKILEGDSFAFSIDVFAATTAGKPVFRLYNDVVGNSKDDRGELGTGADYIGTGWQTFSFDEVITTTSFIRPMSQAVIDAGGYNRLYILFNNTATDVTTPAYLDNIKFNNDNTFVTLADDDADLDANHEWYYDNSPDAFNATISDNSGSVSEAAQATPTTAGNSSPTVLKITRGDDTNNTGITMVGNKFDYTTGNLKFRIYPVCKVGVPANVRVLVRKDGAADNTEQLFTSNVELVSDKWNEVSVDLSTLTPSPAPANNLYDTLVFHFNQGDATSASNGAVFYMDAVQLPKASILSTNNFDLKSFRVFPNPTVDSFQISTEESITSVALLNVTGQLVKTFAPSENYDISDLNAGIYFATVSSENGSQTIKIVKK